MRQSGWKKAWADIFSTIETASADNLKTLSDQLLTEHSYTKDEKDRVVLHVAMTIYDNDNKIWQGSMSLDQVGFGWKSAMASCVSLTVAEAVSAIINDRLNRGVQTAPHDITEARQWLHSLKNNGINISIKNVSI